MSRERAAPQVPIEAFEGSACFGVACPMRGKCLRYYAVCFSTNDQGTRLTCRVADHFPLFVACESALIAADRGTEGRAAPVDQG